MFETANFLLLLQTFQTAHLAIWFLECRKAKTFFLGFFAFFNFSTLFFLWVWIFTKEPFFTLFCSLYLWLLFTFSLCFRSLLILYVFVHIYKPGKALKSVFFFFLYINNNNKILVLEDESCRKNGPLIWWCEFETWKYKYLLAPLVC